MNRLSVVRVGLAGLLTAAGAFVSLLTVAGFAGRAWWVFDLASHFRVQYLLVLVGVSAGLFAVRWPRVALGFAAVAVLNSSVVLPLYVSRAGDRNSPPTVFRAMLVNVYTANTKHAAVVDSVRRHDPDFLIAEEVNERWERHLDELSDRYPYSVFEPRDDNFGMALFSKHPFTSAEIVAVGEAAVPSIVARFELDHGEFALFGTHTLPPVGAEYARLRDAQLAALPSALADLDVPVLLLGDLNASPWSHAFRRLLRETGFHDSSRGMGFQPTWPVGTLALRIPIDHCLYSSGIRLLDKRIGEDIGSDHFPVVVDFAVEAAREP